MTPVDPHVRALLERCAATPSVPIERLTATRNLREAAVDVDVRRYPGMIHGFFQMTAALHSARLLHDELAQWLKSRFAKPS